VAITQRHAYWLLLALLLGITACLPSVSQPATSQPTAGPTSTPTPTPFPSPVPGPNEYIVIAQLNLWYYAPGGPGKQTTPLTPLLGSNYESADPKVIQQQIDWAADYGIDAFSLEWTTPRGVGHSLEDNIDDHFLKAPNLGRIRWCIFDDFVLRLDQTPGLGFNPAKGIDFDDPAVYGAFVSDFDHFAEKYFDNPEYLKIDGRPVVYLWNTWQYKGNIAGAVKDARAKAQARGFDVFITGDEVQAQTFRVTHAGLWDGNTAFNFIMAGVPLVADVGQQAVLTDKTFKQWRDEINGLKVAGRDDLVNFQPGWAPQFNNRLFDKANPIYVPALSKDQVTAMATVARDNAEPVGKSGQRLIWINTWNDWAETTTIEPTANLGPKYPAGNYQFDMLEVVRDVFGSQIFPHID
jgi:Glycosyltransferase WbsX